MGKRRGRKGKKRAAKTTVNCINQTAEETNQVIDPYSEDDSLFEDRRIMWLPWDQKAEEELAAKRVEPFNKIRSKENLVVEYPNAFDEYKPIIYQVDYDEEDFEYLNEDEKMKFILYDKEYAESEGFDVEHFCDRVINSLQRLDLDEDPPDYFLVELKPTIENAIKYFNLTKNRKLVLDKIIKCNYFWHGTTYYATFGVIDQDTGKPLTYQAQLVLDNFTGKTSIHKFRLKPGSPPQLKE